jgi:MOSC domain-containing protein YiiM
MPLEHETRDLRLEMLKADTTLADLMARFPHHGRVEWIGVRPRPGAPPVAVESVEAKAGAGLAGDHRAQRAGSKRQVTLIQHEHLDAVASLLARSRIDPADLRRNLVVSGINLSALRDRRFRIGDAVLEGTGPCAPCSRMEDNLGEGGYNAMRGHGGITARVINGGTIRVGDSVQAEGIDLEERAED